MGRIVTVLGGPLIIVAIVAVAFAFADVLAGIDAWWFRGDE